MQLRACLLIAAAWVFTAGVAGAQPVASILPYEEGVERREAGLFFCHKESIAAELAELLNQGMLAQRQSINGETLHVFGKEHPTMRLMSSRMANGECEVVNYESSFTPVALRFDGRFQDGLDTVSGMNVIQAKMMKSGQEIDVFVLTDVAFIPKSKT